MSRVKKSSKGGAVGLAMMACTFVGQREGLRLFAYQDVVGVWTACYGETKGIRKGMTFTKAECDQQLLTRLDQFGNEIEKCVPVLADEKTISAPRYLAHLSLAYNIGSHAYCGSSVARLTNAGQYLKACDSFIKWNKAGGVVFKGLTVRRNQEADLCRQNKEKPA